MATDWQHRAITAGFPTEFDRPLYYALYIGAALTVLFGWILLAYLTVIIIGLVF
jgi:hypothetical protein